MAAAGLALGEMPEEPINREDVVWECPRKGCDFSTTQPAHATAVAAFHLCSNGRKQSVELRAQRGEAR